jgi:hypothetical protein
MQEKPHPAVLMPKVDTIAAVGHAVRAHISPAAVPLKRKRIALALAGIADLVQAGAFPVFAPGAPSPAVDALDAVVVVALTVILGFRWRLLISLAVELLPIATLFPTWTAVVASLPVLPEEASPKIIDADSGREVPER